jgi:hypothetical protein
LLASPIVYVVELDRFAAGTEHSAGNACTLSSRYLHDNRARRHDADSVADAMHRTNNSGIALALVRLRVRQPQTSRRDVADFSPHLRPLMELAKTPVVETPVRRDLFL